MTHSPMHGKDRRALDSLFLGPSTSEAPEGQKPLKGKKLSLDEAAAMRGDATEDLAAKGAREDKPSGAEGGAGSKREDGAARGIESIGRGVQKLTVGSPPAAPEPQGAAGAASGGGGPGSRPAAPDLCGRAAQELCQARPIAGPQQPDAALTQKEKKEKRKQQVQFVKKDKPKLTGGEEGQEKQRGCQGRPQAEQGKDGGGGGGSGKKADKPAASLSRPRSGPQSEFDNEKRVQRQKRKSLVPRETQEKSVELFSHLPQFDNSTLHESFQSLLSSGLHPEVVKLGRAYGTRASREGTPGAQPCAGSSSSAVSRTAGRPRRQVADEGPDKPHQRDHPVPDRLQVALAVSMGTIRHFWTRMGRSIPEPLTWRPRRFWWRPSTSTSRTRSWTRRPSLLRHTRFRRVTYPDLFLSSSVLKTIQCAHQRVPSRVIVVDSRPHFEGKKLVSSWRTRGELHLRLHHPLSYIMPQVTSVFWCGERATNGTVVSRVGSASVAVTAGLQHSHRRKRRGGEVLHRVQLDAITQRAKDPDALAEVKGRPYATFVNWSALPA